MSRQKISFCSALAVSVMLLIGSRPARAEVAFTLPTPTDFRNNSWAFGELFTVNEAITVTALGAYDAGGDGFVTAGGLPAGIFNFTTDTLLTSANVMSSDPLSAGFRFHSIAPITLVPGVIYDDVTVNESDLYNINLSFTVNPAIDRSGYAYGLSTTLQILTNLQGSERIWLSNFEFQSAIPEPSSVVMASLGAIGLGLFRAFHGMCRRAR
jgi:hypothetical protein